MGARKKSSRRKSYRGKQTVASVVFTLIVVVGIIIAFFILLPHARNNVNTPQGQTRAPQIQEPPAFILDPTPEPLESVPLAEAPLDIESLEQEFLLEELEDTEIDPAALELLEQLPPIEIPPTVTDPDPVQQAEVSQTEIVETVSRRVYFVQETSDGNLELVYVNRRLRSSPSPLLDSLVELLRGPDPEERNHRITSYIPRGARIRSVDIRGNTAHIDFTEEFYYGEHGREGFDAQILQITSTAQEFPSVRDVRLYVEGLPAEILGHGH